MMNTTSYVTEIADGLSAIHRREGFAQFFVVLLRELAKGKAVSRQALCTALGWPDASVAAILSAMPDIEYDARGDIAGYGMTLRETPHAFEVDGHSLYVWCALDALMFPAMIGKSARGVALSGNGRTDRADGDTRTGDRNRSAGCGHLAAAPAPNGQHTTGVLLLCALLLLQFGRQEVGRATGRSRGDHDR